jgi:hypothetical protein
VTYLLMWANPYGVSARLCHGWDDLRTAIRILHDSCGVSYRRMRVETA